MTALSNTQYAGVWSAGEVARYLQEATIPMRLACQTLSGHPLVTSLWFVVEGGHLWCAVQRNSRVAGHCRLHPNCGFEVAGDQPPYKGVRGAAEVALFPEEGERILRTLLVRYLHSTESDLARWLLDRAADEVALRITPLRIYSWDYTARMRDSLAGT
jgi:hypothetical protein